MLDEPGPPPVSSRTRRPSSPSAPRPPTAPPLLAPQPRRQATLPDELVDDSTVLTNVEEMLEGFEWRGSVGNYSSDGGSGGGGKGRKADEIEKRLIGELKALEAASIHAIMESDDRVTGVIKHLDDALGELDRMDLLIGLYKTQLNVRFSLYFHQSLVESDVVSVTDRSS